MIKVPLPLILIIPSVDFMAAGLANAIIRVEHVKKIYKSKDLEYEAIRDISMHVNKGEFVTIIGPSGSGKTTLLDLIGTLDTPTNGRIFIDGIDTSKFGDDGLSQLRNRKIGFIFQSYNLVPYLSALQNATLPLMVDGLDNSDTIERAKFLLSEMGLGQKLEKKPTELSGGEQQRVAIARALVNNPPIILADEPTGNLDSKSAEIVLNMLKRLGKNNGVTIVLVTHDPHVASLSERSIYLKDGLVEKDTKTRKTKVRK